ncbi:hypothetical protein NQZ68_003857 [Dissostichus eleginoides]|nr:hypothetical protein NQZ68_003857 [Dissostichus eleginoides]
MQAFSLSVSADFFTHMSEPEPERINSNNLSVILQSSELQIRPCQELWSQRNEGDHGIFLCHLSSPQCVGRPGLHRHRRQGRLLLWATAAKQNGAKKFHSQFP